MVKKTLAFVFALASSLTMAVGAEAKMTSRIIDGSVAKGNIERVNNNIHWNSSLSQALDQARRENKMVLWIQMIGQMSGST
jgi:hypothetical protein